MDEKHMTDGQARSWWLGNGGSFHGPKSETATMPEAELLPLLRKMAAVCRAADDLDRIIDGVAIHVVSNNGINGIDLAKRVVRAKKRVQDALSDLTHRGWPRS